MRAMLRSLLMLFAVLSAAQLSTTAAQAGKRVVALRCSGHDLGAETIVLSGDHLLVRNLPAVTGAWVDVEVQVSPPVQEDDDGRKLGLILASVQIEVG